MRGSKGCRVELGSGEGTLFQEQLLHRGKEGSGQESEQVFLVPHTDSGWRC